MDTQFSLIPFIEDKSFTIEGHISLKENIVHCKVNILGPLETLKIKTKSKIPQKKEGIWHSTCFEVFLSSSETVAYTEWNLCPSGDWWVMDFSKYRERIEISGLDTRKPQYQQWSLENPNQLSGQFGINIPQNISSQSLKLGLTSILESKNGIKTYWALAHLQKNPDFHIYESFLTEGKIRSLFAKSKDLHL